MKRFILIALLVLPISACRSINDNGPDISFIGISSGTLATPLDELEFKDRFSTDELNLVAVVAFRDPVDETNVQATWFSPDDRRMPLGRKTIKMESGATIARFSFASREEWQNVPFMLDIRANLGEGENRRTASGQLNFFVGMDDKQVASYWDDFNAYRDNEREKRAMYARKKQAEEKVMAQARLRLNASVAGIAHRYDVNGDGAEEIIIIDPPRSEPFMGAAETGAVFSADVKKFSITNLSGATVLETREEGKGIVMYGIQGPLATGLPEGADIHLVLYPLFVSIEWSENEKRCKQMFTFNEKWIDEGEGVVCRQH